MTLDLVEMVHKINHEVLVPSFLEDFVFQLKFFSLFLTSGFNVIIMLLLWDLEVIYYHFRTPIFCPHRCWWRILGTIHYFGKFEMLMTDYLTAGGHGQMVHQQNLTNTIIRLQNIITVPHIHHQHHCKQTKCL